MERCNILLGDMRANPLSEWFRDPVDHIALGLTDYPQVISQPMDIGTIGKKCERQQYISTEDYAHDVRLVWQNAITYNSAHSMFGVVAGILAQIFDRRFALITRSATADPGRPIPDRPGWPTFQQKKKFYDLCTRLTLADLNQMVSLVQRGCQSAVQQCGDKEVEVCSSRPPLGHVHRSRAAKRCSRPPVQPESPSRLRDALAAGGCRRARLGHFHKGDAVGDFEDQDGAKDGELTCRARAGEARDARGILRVARAHVFWPRLAAHRLSDGIWGAALSAREMLRGPEVMQWRGVLRRQHSLERHPRLLARVVTCLLAQASGMDPMLIRAYSARCQRSDAIAGEQEGGLMGVWASSSCRARARSMHLGTR